MHDFFKHFTLTPLWLIAMSLACSKTWGATRTWDGGGNGTNWRTSNNWSPNTRPAANDSLVFAGTTSVSNTNNFAADTAFAGISFSNGAGAFTLAGNRITLTGNVVNNDDSLQTLNLPMILSGNRTFQTASTGSLAVGGVLSGGGGLTKTGTATLTLSGNNSYTGATSVEAGLLYVNGNQSASTGPLTIAAGAYLGGVGTIGGATTISGIHVPGSTSAAAGTQTFTGGLSYASGSIFSWTLSADSTTTGYDKIIGSGALNVDSSAVFRVVLGTNVASQSSSFWDVNHTWSDVFTGFTGGAFSNSALRVIDTQGTALDTSSQGSFSISGTTLSWSAVPEPSATLAGLLLAAGLLRRRRA